MIRAKKSLGQNFLNSKAVARDIVRAAEIYGGATSINLEVAPPDFGDMVLEIGPGKGFLTGELLASGARVVAVEKDDRMIPLLSEKFADEITRGQFTLIHGDILKFDPKTYKLKPNSYKLIANIPFYLTGHIIRTFLEAESKPERMILMVQKEVATRIVARTKKPFDSAQGKESILSIAVKAYGTPKLIKKVPARYFTPAPKVDSAILAITNISGKNFPDKNAEKVFFEIVRAGFAHKRKILAGNLKEIYGGRTSEILREAGIAENARAENLSLDQWLSLAQKHASTVHRN
ncbi:MAG: 16S rRNA (adenine(1518)-N(6)/adenine(1519)-N(6))-dimethyltransferase RsmA [Patescibacteria group bacterium]